MGSTARLAPLQKIAAIALCGLVAATAASCGSPAADGGGPAAPSALPTMPVQVPTGVEVPPTATDLIREAYVVARGRFVGGPGAPMSTQVLEVPADIFVPPVGPYVDMLFDASTTTLAGCVQQYGDQSVQPAAECWIGSTDG